MIETLFLFLIALIIIALVQTIINNDDRMILAFGLTFIIFLFVKAGDLLSKGIIDIDEFIRIINVIINTL